MHTFYCNYFFAWNSGGPYTRGPPGLCLPCLPHCYATASTYDCIHVVAAQWFGGVKTSCTQRAAVPVAHLANASTGRQHSRLSDPVSVVHRHQSVSQRQRRWNAQERLFITRATPSLVRVRGDANASSQLPRHSATGVLHRVPRVVFNVHYSNPLHASLDCLRVFVSVFHHCSCRYRFF